MIRVRMIPTAGWLLALTLAPSVHAQTAPEPVATDSVADAAPDVTEPADGVRVATLPEALRRAAAANPDILAQRARTRSANNRFPAARAAYGPQLTASATAGYQRDRQEIFANRFIGAQGFSTTAQLILTQPLFTFGRNRSAEQIALAEVEFARSQQRVAENQTLLDAVSAYVAVQRDTTLVAVAQSNLALLDRQYRASDERFRVREITISDLQQVETRLALARAQQVEARGSLGASRGQFLRVIGALPADTLAPVKLATPAPVSLDAAYRLADRNAPLLRAASAREKISRGSIEAVRAEMGPRIDLRGTAQHGVASPYNNDLRLNSLRGEVQFQMPLIDLGLRRSRLAEAKEANDADWRLIDSAGREVRQTVLASWERLAASTRALASYAVAVDAAQRAYDGAVLQEKAGSRTTLDVLDLARDLLNVKTNLVVAQADIDVARATLLAAIGDLAGPDRSEEERHFDRVARRGDIPLLTGTLSGLEDPLVRDTARDRPIRDSARDIRAGSVVSP